MKLKKWRTWIGVGAVGIGVTAAAVWAAPQQTPEEIADACLGEMERTSDNAIKSISFISGDCNEVFNDLEEDGQARSKYFTAAGKCVGDVEKLTSRAESQINKTYNKCVSKLERAGAAPPLIESVSEGRNDALQNLYEASFLEAVQIHDNLGDAAFPI